MGSGKKACKRYNYNNISRYYLFLMNQKYKKAIGNSFDGLKRLNDTIQTAIQVFIGNLVPSAPKSTCTTTGFAEGIYQFKGDG